MTEKSFKLTIGKKIFLGFSILIVIYLGMALHSYYDLKEISGLAENAVPLSSRIISLQEFAISLESLEKDIDKFFTVNYKENEEEANKEFKQMHSIIWSLKNDTDSKSMDGLLEMERILSEIQSNFNYLAKIEQNSANSREINEKRFLIYELINSERQKHRELLLETTNKIQVNVLDQQRGISGIIKEFLMLGISILVFGVLLSIITSRSISRPIEKLRAATTEIGQGRLNINIPIQSNDEVGQLASAFNKMTGELQKTTVSKDYVENIIRSMFDTLVVTAPDGTIQTVNKAICDLLGYRPEELLGQSILMILSDENPESKSSNIKEILKNGSIHNMEKEFLAKDGRKIPILLSISSMCDNERNILGLVCVARDITELKRTEDELCELYQFNQEVISGAGEGITVYDLEFRYMLWNKFMETMTGVLQEDVLGKKALDVFPHLREQGIDLLLEKAINGKTVSSNDTPYKIPGTDKSGWVNATYAPHRDANGKIVGVIATVRDITKRKKAEDLLNKSKEFAETVINSMKDAIAIIDVNTFRIINANSYFLEIYGMREEELIGKTCYEITHKRARPCTPPDDICPLMDTLNTGKYSTAEHVHYTKSGEKRYVEVSTTPVKDEFGKVVTVIHVARDITERKVAEDKIKASLKEKETLLKEIHHRVKNNLQIVSSLLDHQSQFIKDKKVIEIFTDSQNRIASMALVHEKLYQSKDLGKIDFSDYINDLAANLFQSYIENSGKIRLNMKIENIQLDIDFAIPCGLIINELVTNSLKYAFPAGSVGEIKIVFRKTIENMLELVISDNGVGIPPDLDFRKTGSLGLHLVTILAENQLHGKINLNRNEGTEFKIEFKGIK
ncbi:MAG TPA: PAS domain S-box protein [Candidatus Methanoperedens sp.]|nr:PAS domain S-box protein [Candidatus Methanoperedens sp.]